ncbi:MAG: nitrilase-related carbon-nitrogen hydrolase [Melioribacteraceae bacterium]
MKIGLIQQKASLNKEENIKKGIEAVRTAAALGAKIISFSELAFIPFFPQKPSNQKPLNLVEKIPGPTTGLFSDLAKELKVVIILNLYEQEGEAAYDSSPVIDADGKILGTTRMIHITDYECFHEKDVYTPGNNGAPVYDTQYGKIGVAICYDRHYPEYMRALALKGAQIVFIPQAGATGEWPEGLYEAEMRVAAFQNGYFTALCNRVGQEECLNFSGESFVCDPAGEVIARAGMGTEEILICDIDYEKCGTSHAKRLFFRDRRPELYNNWLNYGEKREQ